MSRNIGGVEGPDQGTLSNHYVSINAALKHRREQPMTPTKTESLIAEAVERIKGWAAYWRTEVFQGVGLPDDPFPLKDAAAIDTVLSALIAAQAENAKLREALVRLKKAVAGVAPHFEKPLTIDTIPLWQELDAAGKAAREALENP